MTTPPFSSESFTNADFYHQVLRSLPFDVTIYEILGHHHWRVVYTYLPSMNQSEEDAQAMVGKLAEEVVPLEVLSQIYQRGDQVLKTGEKVVVEDSYALPTGTFWAYSTFLPVRDRSGTITHFMAYWENITERKQRELEERQQQEVIIHQQQAVLTELSTPILSIDEQTLAMPLIGSVDSHRAQQIMDVLLEGVEHYKATIVILDITGVPIVDTRVADIFVRASQAVALLGAQVIITGIRPEVAQTIVGLGVDLRTITTLGTLRDGIAFALKRNAAI